MNMNKIYMHKVCMCVRTLAGIISYLWPHKMETRSVLLLNMRKSLRECFFFSNFFLFSEIKFHGSRSSRVVISACCHANYHGCER